MNKSSRTIRLIEGSLHRLETDAGVSAIDALGVLDELRRLERKWNEQVAAGSPRRIEADFRHMNGWYRRWLLAARSIAASSVANDAVDQLREEMRKVEATLK